MVRWAFTGPVDWVLKGSCGIFVAGEDICDIFIAGGYC
jgi:hypothetical protein